MYVKKILRGSTPTLQMKALVSSHQLPWCFQKYVYCDAQRHVCVLIATEYGFSQSCNTAWDKPRRSFCSSSCWLPVNIRQLCQDGHPVYDGFKAENMKEFVLLWKKVTKAVIMATNFAALCYSASSNWICAPNEGTEINLLSPWLAMLNWKVTLRRTLFLSNPYRYSTGLRRASINSPL